MAVTTTGATTGLVDKGLRRGALGLASSVVVGVASTAPAYSLAASLGFVVAAVGLQSPAIMIIAFVPMYLIAVAYQQLNTVEPDCGTTFTWATKAFGPISGWMGGWGIIAADIIVMANLAQIAGQYGFLLFGANGIGNDATSNWVTLAGVLWIVVMTVICYLGIEVSARLQMALLSVEVTMLAIFSVVALTKVYSGSAPHGSIHPSYTWFDPFRIGISPFFAGLLTALFIYWGWDTAVSVNEETRDANRTPGLAAVLSTFLLLGTYAVVTVAAQAFAGVGGAGIGLDNSNNSGDVLSVLGKAVFGSSGVGTVFVKLLLVMVLTSASASTQTTILPTARTSLSMAAYRAIPRRFARIHPRFQTPTWSTVGMGLLSIAFYVVMVKISSNVLGDTISSLGLMIAFYYGLTGFACFWYFRRHNRGSVGEFWRRAVAPLAGGVMLLGAFGYSVWQMWYSNYGNTFWTIPALRWQVGGVFLTGVGALVLGVVLMVIYRFVAPEFFRGETLGPATPVRTVDAAAAGHLSLPDSLSQEHLVIPPDPPP